MDRQRPTREEIARIFQTDPEKLPRAPIIAEPFLDAIHDNRSSAKDLVKILEFEPELFQNMLHRLNSIPGGHDRPITTMQQAVVMLGYEKLASLALETLFFLFCIQPLGRSDFDRLTFWRHSLIVAFLAEGLAAEIGHINRAEAFLAGLSHDMGKWFQDSYGRISQKSFLRAADNAPGSMVERERMLLGMGHDDVGCYFLSSWGFSQRLTEVVRLHHHSGFDQSTDTATAALVAVVQTADFLAWAQGMGSVERGCGPILSQESNRIAPLEKTNLPRLLQSLDKNIRPAAAHYGFFFPTTSQFRENLLRTNIRLGKINANLSSRLQRRVKSRANDPSPHILLVPHRSLDAEVIYRTSLEAIRSDFPFARVSLLVLDRNQRELVVKDRGASRRAPGIPKGLRIPLTNGDSGFVTCLRQRRPSLVDGHHHPDRSLLQRLATEAIGLVPVVGNHTVHALLAVDNAGNGTDLDPHGLRELASLGREMGMALDQARLHRKVREDASQDGLTRLWNRSRICQYMADTCQQAEKRLEPFSIALVDVDFFKNFNDQFGHQEGDRVLRLVAGVMKKLSRSKERVGRYGGEEFLVILPETDLNSAILYCERIRQAIMQVGEVLGRRLPGRRLTVSIGVATLQDQTESVDALLGQADQALYTAKENGRNRVIGAMPTLSRASPFPRRDNRFLPAIRKFPIRKPDTENHHPHHPLNGY